MKFFQKIKSIPSIVREIKILFVAYTDKRTPRGIQILAGAVTVGYLLWTVDIIPDFFPLFGVLDDAVAIPLLAGLFSRWIPRHILDDARRKTTATPTK